MAKFERSERKDNRGPRTSSPRRDNRGSRSFGDNPRGNRGYSDRDSGYGGGRRDVEKTRVTCDSCGSKCEVPFKPTSNKPVYCDDCFSKKGKSGPSNRSNKDFDIINEKLDKIMNALKVR